MGFHAVESHDEPCANEPWKTEVARGAITWSTTDSPLRWGTPYDFRFDANAQPIDSAMVSLGLCAPGASRDNVPR